MSPPTVMVIEDDLDCQEAVADALLYEGYAVVTACNGAEALAQLEATSEIGLILLDLMLPVMDGWQFLEARRDHPALAAIPVVLLSGERDLDRHARDLGADDSLGKPVELAALLSTARRIAGAP